MAPQHGGSKQHQYHEDNGEPGCQTLEEVNKMFRNFWDPTTYWQCEAQNKAAKLCRCPASKLYSEKHGSCVHYTEWEWSEPVEPPSRPKKS